MIDDGRFINATTKLVHDLDVINHIRQIKKQIHPVNVLVVEGTMHLLRHVSFVDCPGHDILMATMLNGAAVMDAALLLIAGNEPCPQPQTSEHLAAIEIMKLQHIIILQNKVDLMKESAAEEHYQSIKKFIKGRNPPLSVVRVCRLISVY